mmetsp:Transcript_43297/g.88529  ORF Transcript_43297/g.88529 Transcript_43297/m.88529 type:complete len:217 (+) Transcript_43297:70-720(+)|eukprot:TRINITY_DN33394_c0_g1_i1.p2 TRINITY_DN33394_c0_g1~~TRINITY_DN33394_c0_g1_i1.p2  ORF type:complete len:217 (+),score=34.32 TRINITY_DN33394_c0_g1_i1:49-699(+)
MVKHNNVVPNAHFRKQWQRRVSVNFNQAAQKKARRAARAAKAAAIAPRPLDKLRPVVRCQTARYNRRVRAGRGFTLDELKAAGINRQLAKTIGIAVDARRTNRSVASMNANVERLKQYKAQLIVFPRGSNKKPRGGDSAPELTSQAAQNTVSALFPVTQAADVVETANLAEARAKTGAFRTLRIERCNARMVGIRERNARLAAEQAAILANKKKKK